MSGVDCRECTHVGHVLLDHLVEAHNLSPEQYTAKHPGAKTVSEEALKAWEGRSVKTRKPAPLAGALQTSLMGVTVGVDAGVSPEQCLPAPEGYRLPTKGSARGKTERALWSLIAGDRVFIHGLPGTGKDALVHYYSAVTRRPAMILTFRPGTDLSPWFYRRSLRAEDNGYVYGALWNAITKGVKGRDGRIRPVLVLLSDVDRADPAQAEWFRMLTDSICGRVLGPTGEMVELFKGTQFVFTANSCGTGDSRGRMTSSNVMDASIMDRLGSKVEFTYLSWDDEVEALREKYPTIAEKAPEVFTQLEGACTALRNAVAKEVLYCEFTHRSLCDILDEVRRRIRFMGKVETNVLGKSFPAWLDGLGDDNRIEAKRLIDGFITGGTIGKGTKGEDEDD